MYAGAVFERIVAVGHLLRLAHVARDGARVVHEQQQNQRRHGQRLHFSCKLTYAPFHTGNFSPAKFPFEIQVTRDCPCVRFARAPVFRQKKISQNRTCSIFRERFCLSQGSFRKKSVKGACRLMSNPHRRRPDATRRRSRVTSASQV